jgi:hypothetical protein
MTRAERRINWQSIINTQAASGTSAAAYCREHHINVHLFYSWRRRFRESQCVDAGGFVELRSGSPLAKDTGIRIFLDAGLCIEVARGFDSATLCAVIDALDRRRCSV